MGRPREFDEQEILQKAIELFGTQGFDVLSVDTVLNALGMNRASFYKLFGSKHGLARAALQHACTRAQNGVLDPHAQDFIVVALIELAQVNPAFNQLCTEAVALFFASDPARLGQQLLTRANIKILSGGNHE